MSQTSPTESIEHRAPQPAGRLASRSFVGLLVTQMLGATNDNIFRWLAIGVAKGFVGKDQVGFVLAAGTACFVLPYLVLAAPAGYLADRFSKRSVIVGCKVAEIVIMTLGVAAILSQSLTFLFGVVALMGAQSALFGPSKLGSIPEMLKASKISSANGVMGLTTVGAIVVGTAIGNVLSDTMSAGQAGGMKNWWIVAAVLIGVAAIGWVASLSIVRLPVANPKRRFPWRAPQQTLRDLGQLASDRPMLRVALGIAFFWSLGTLANLNIDQFAFDGGVTQQSQIVPLLISLTFGVGLGSVLAGIWSAGRVELGILPLGAAGIAVSSMLLFTVQGSLVDATLAWTAGYVWACVFLVGLGMSAGLFNIPLTAYMQHRSPVESRGSILAANNFLTFSTILVASLLYSGLRVHAIDGSLDNVAEANPPGLSTQAEQRIARTAGRLEAAIEATPGGEARPKTEAYLGGAAGDERAALTARLLYLELTLEGAPDKTPETLAALRRRFPEHEQLAARVFDEAAGHPLFSATQIFLFCGAFTVPVFLYIVLLIPQACIRFVVWLASRTAYRIRIYGDENLPDRGGALLVANHVSWLDGILLLLTSTRPIRMVVWAGNFEARWLKWLADLFGAIMLSPRPKELVKSLRVATKALENGELVCIFPEGGITRSGQLQAFKPGMMRILKGTGTPVIPVYLDELWGSIFSFRGGKFFWKWPRRWPYPVSIFFGKPIERPSDVHEIRQAVVQLGAHAVQQRKDRTIPLPISFLKSCKRRKFGSKIADSSGAELTGGSLLTRTFVLRRILRREVLAPDERYVGLLLPPTVAGVVVNAAMALDRRIAVNLNYTVSSDVMNQCIAQCGIKHVLTSRKVMEKLDLQIDAELVFLEDFKEKATAVDKLAAAAAAFVVPAGILARTLGLVDISPDDAITVIFTSGSTGTPKGVVLTHANIASNCQAIDQIVQLTSKDVLLGILPFFHSFGYTVTIWCVLMLDVKGIYHFSPLDARQVGKLSRKHGGTILLSTPTFLRTYARRIPAEDFETMDVVVAGAEKLTRSVADAFEKKFGVRPVEGYGTTETAPVVSVNIPPSRTRGDFGVDIKEGTIGRPMPGVMARVVDLDSGEPLGTDAAGMLMVKGPNVMKGYLNMPEKTAEVLHDGWYETGDVAMIDEDGFITITGRQSRFSKIGGEMVPHVRIEETLEAIIGEDENDDGGPRLAVTAVPDERKGERIVVLHRALPRSPDEMRKALSAAGLPNIYIPSADSFVQVDQLPLLGTGKLDLRALKEMALKFGQ